MAEDVRITWRNWRYRVFGDPYLVWHDGPDFRRLYDAYDESAEEVDRMLVVGVAQSDPLAAECIGRLEPDKAVPRALAALTATGRDPSGEFALRRAQALFALTKDAGYRAAMIQLLEGDDHWGVRIKAAIAIGDLKPTTAAIDALEHAVASKDYLIRYHSANALLRYAGQKADIGQHVLFEAIASPRDSDEPTEANRKAWAEAGEQLSSDARAAL